MKPFRAALLLAVVVFALVSCQLAEFAAPPLGDGHPATGTLSLVLRMNDGLRGARTLAPPIVMTIASFEVRGAGPLGDAFGPLGNTSGYLELPGLTPGSWTITVDGLNASGTVIGSGQAQVTIIAGTATSANIEIRPLTGSGTLSLSLTLEVGTIKKKEGSLVGTLTPAGGSPATLAFTLLPSENNPTSATCSSTVAAGYYILNLILTRADKTTWGTVEAVRIIEGQITTGTWGPL